MRVGKGVIAVIAAAACAMTMTAAPAFAGDGDRQGHGNPDPIKVIASGLNGPRQIADGGGSRLFVAESDIGRISAINIRSGSVTPSVSNLGNNLTQGVDYVNGKLAIANGGPGPGEPPVEPPAIPQSLLTARPGGTATQFADLLAFELAKNPDGQIQFDPTTNLPLDTLSNPYYVLDDRRGLGFVLVADAGANAVLAIDKKGKIKPFFVPPVIKDGACADVVNNTPDGIGCDPVPTGLAYGPRNTLYVSTLQSEVSGEGRVYVLDARSGKINDVIKGFTAPTGVAVDYQGNVYVSEVLEGAPEGDGPPPPDFDPSAVGQIVKVGCHGELTYAQVTMPSGLLFENGKLYASAWSIARFVGIPDAGQVVQVNDSAFVAAAA